MFSFKFIAIEYFEILLIASLSFTAYADTSPETSSLGSRNSSIEEYPFLVSVLFRTYTTHSSGYIFACTGSILSPEFVLIPASCVGSRYENEISVRAGSSFRFANGSEHGVQKIILHPDIKKSARGNDIALLRLKNPIELDGRTKQAARIFGPEEDKIDFNKTLPVIAGWGRTERNHSMSNWWDIAQIQTIPMSFFDTDKCAKIYEKLEVSGKCDNSEYILSDGEMCFLAVPKADGTWNRGDKGSPLVVDGKLGGINLRWGPNYLLPNVFTMILHHRAWIDREMSLD